MLRTRGFGYDAKGNQTSATDGLNATTTRTFNAANQDLRAGRQRSRDPDPLLLPAGELVGIVSRIVGVIPTKSAVRPPGARRSRSGAVMWERDGR